MLFNRDGAVESRFNNAAVARTLAAASGGMEVNNTSTGAGFERVLTTSDLVSSGVPIAYASLRRTGNQSIATGTPTQVSWDATVAEDPGTWFTSGTDLNVPSGVDAVAIAATIRFDNSSAGGSRTVTIERNNAPVNSPMSSYTDNGPFDATADTIVTVGPIVLSVTGGSDTLQIEVFQDTGGNLNVVAGCIVSVWAVG